MSPVFGGYRGVGAIRRDAQMMSIRTFLVDAAGVPRPCSAARFERLWKGDPRERLLGHQGALAQFADVFVELVGGLPRRILQIDCLRIRVTREGFLDQGERERLMSLAVRSLRLPSPWRGVDTALEGDHRFARRAMRHFRWLPTAHQRATMERLALRRRNRR